MAQSSLGAFSLSLFVKDINASKVFYEKLGFKQVSGVLEQNWVVMGNGPTKIGLFQGHIKANTLTFNPGWTQFKEQLDDFVDIRELQQSCEKSGLTIDPSCKIKEEDLGGKGPAYFMLVDPDGNPILVDQHVTHS